MRKRKHLKRAAAIFLAMMILGQSCNVFAEDAVSQQVDETTAEASEENPGDSLNIVDDVTDDGSSNGVAADSDDEGTVTNTENTEMTTEENDAADVQENLPDAQADIEAQAEEIGYTLQYEAHSQSIGWQGWKSEGELAGTTGMSKRMEALRIQVLKETADTEKNNQKQIEVVSDAIEYRAHCQTIGWQDWVSGSDYAGTTGMSKRLEAIEIRLKGELAEEYDIYYQVHSSKFGNLAWAKNGETAGTSGYARAIEAITIRLVKKGSQNAPQQTGRSYLSPTAKGTVTYVSHVQTYGWMDSVADGAVSGTQGQSKRMEALRIYLENPKDTSGKEIAGSIEYQAHSQTYGWMGWKKEGEIAGTTGEAKRLEAVQIRLTGALAEKYDVFYRTHSSYWGTLGWAKNGEIAGTTGFYRSIESIEIKLVEKGSADAPAQSGRTYLDSAQIGKLSFSACMKDGGWQSAVGNGGTAGAAGQSKTIEALKMQIASGEAGNVSGLFNGGISYKVHLQGTGWMNAVSNGAEAGAAGKGKRVEAVAISLTGELAQYCDVYYRAYVQDYGWLGWAKNGQAAGTTNCAYRMEALQVRIIPKTASAPGANSDYYKDVKYKVRYENAVNQLLNNGGWDLYSCYLWIVRNFRYQTLPIPMDPPEGYTREEGYAIYGLENNRGNCYCYAASFAAAAKKLGYDARFIEGQVGMARGGLGPHGWVEIVVNGTTYVCDPDGEAELGMNFYMVTYGSAGLQYYK